MEVTFENLERVMNLCAKAHNTYLDVWEEDGQIGIFKESVPTFADVKSIAKAFFTCNPNEITECAWGYSTIYVPNQDYWRKEVDTDLLSTALPYGWLDQMKEVA